MVLHRLLFGKPQRLFNLVDLNNSQLVWLFFLSVLLNVY